uniref:BLOC-1-related complex subunit 5 n=1 Tax=Rhabditophanes sp. KR3021 TaxID=114890 RepID=A0AC35TLQ8_9BILA
MFFDDNLMDDEDSYSPEPGKTAQKDQKRHNFVLTLMVDENELNKKRINEIDVNQLLLPDQNRLPPSNMKVATALLDCKTYLNRDFRLIKLNSSVNEHIKSILTGEQRLSIIRKSMKKFVEERDCQQSNKLHVFEKDALSLYVTKIKDTLHEVENILEGQQGSDKCVSALKEHLVQADFLSKAIENLLIKE